MRGYRGRYPLLTDEDLISLLGDGDAQALALLYDRHSRAAFSLAYRMMGERQASEDLAQDAFISVRLKWAAVWWRRFWTPLY